MSRIRILPTISALILTLAVLFGGFQVYQTYAVVRPLEVQLARIAHVQSAVVTMQGTVPEIVVTLGPTKDLQTTYSQMESQIANAFGSSVTIYLKDRRTPFLRQAYESLEPILFQGASHGDYMGMIASFDKAAAALGARARVTMNAQDIFVQLDRGSAYLYDIVPYANKALEVSGQ